jgi:hypothetical protein
LNNVLTKSWHRNLIFIPKLPPQWESSWYIQDLETWTGGLGKLHWDNYTKALLPLSWRLVWRCGGINRRPTASSFKNYRTEWWERELEHSDTHFLLPWRLN